MVRRGHIESRRLPGEASMSTQTTATPGMGWRTPAIILIAGCMIGTIGFGPRSALGLFLTPMSQTYGWGRDVFGARARHSGPAPGAR